MASSAGFVLKVYANEADARSNSSPLPVASAADSAGSIVNNVSQTGTNHFFTFQRYWYRIEANEPVSELYIDWDDGEDNSPDKANVSIIKTNKPSFFGIVSHIYTQSRLFYPLIRVKSVEGFLSKWYTPHAGTSTTNLNVISGLDDSFKTTTTSGLLVDRGQNSFSVISVEKNDGVTTAHARIPVFNPANVPPVGVLKVDRKKVFSGIDNVWLGNNSRILNQTSVEFPQTATVYAYCDNNNRVGAQVKVTYQEGRVGGEANSITLLTGTKGSGATDGSITAADVEQAFVTITTMDEKYGLWWNINNQHVSPPAALAALATVLIRVDLPAGGLGGASETTMHDLAVGTVAALDDEIFYPAGQTAFGSEFTASHNSTEFRQDNCVTEVGATVTHVANADIVVGLAVRQTGGTSAGIPGGTTIASITGTPGTSTSFELSAAATSAQDPVTLTFDSGEGLAKTIIITHNKKGMPFVAAGPAMTYDDGTVSDLPLVTSHGTGGINVTNAGVDASDGTIKQKTLTTTASGIIPQASDTGSARIDNTYQILKAELINNLENTDSYGGSSGTTTLAAGERIFLMSSLSKSTTDPNTHPNVEDRTFNTNICNTICSVSLGNPIVDLNSLGTRLTADSTESKVRCSNKSNLYYYMDDNKLVSGDDAGNSANHQEQTPDQVTDKLISQANTDSQGTIGVKDLRFNFDWWRDHQDNNYRFYSTKRLIRAQVQDNHTAVTDDAFNISPIVHFEPDRYLGINVQTDGAQPSEIDKWNYGALLFTNQTKLRAPDWKNLAVTNNAGRLPMIGCLTSGTHPLLPSTAFDTLATADHYGPDNVTDATSTTETESPMVGPRNAIFMTRKEKYDRIFVRTSHDRFIAEGTFTPTLMDNDITVGTTLGWPKVRIQALYPAKKNANSSTIIWKALPIVDRTKLKGKDDSSFYTSGELIFNPPSDWEKTSHSTNIQYPFEDNFFNDTANSEGINTVWDLPSYAILILITMISSSGGGGGVETAKPSFNIMSIYPYNNSHSQLIEIVDPMHVSLNSYGIAQSVSFVRKGSFQEIKDRSGISQMRRVGAEGGAIKLGSIDLKSDAKTTRVKFDEFQRNATPVYYDVIHKDDSITRLFGVMTEMAEDHPTAKVIPKFSCNMKVTHIAEIDSSGNITGNGYKPLGGDVIDVEQYLSTS